MREEEDTAAETDDSGDEGELGGSAETPEPARIPSDDEREAEADEPDDESGSDDAADDASDNEDSDEEPDSGE